MENSIKQRLIAYLKTKRLTQREFSRRTGLSTGYITNLHDKPAERILSIILSTFPDLSREWLLTGEGDMLTTGGAPDAPGASEYEAVLIPLSAHGGALVGFDNDGFRPSDCERIVTPIRGVDVAITLAGDSMAPDYPAGSCLLLKRIDPSAFIAWGNVFVLDTPNGAVVKELHPTDTPGRVRCHSRNPLFEDFEVSLADVRAVFRVLACITRY